MKAQKVFLHFHWKCDKKERVHFVRFFLHEIALITILSPGGPSLELCSIHLDLPKGEDEAAISRL